MITAKKILKEIDCKFLSLYQGDGYWYFSYDNNYEGGRLVYETESVYVMRLNWMELSRWVEAGKEFVKKMEKIDE